MQTRQDMDPKEFTQAKNDLTEKLKALEDELNGHLAGEYGITEGTKKAREKYANWLLSHKPFHWLIDFYGIIKNGGFDVIIGNPPYVELPKIKDTYTVKGYKTLGTNNLFSLVAERSKGLVRLSGRLGIILPNSSVSAAKMSSLQRELKERSSCWISNFAWRPSKLFVGANMLLAIWIIETNERELCFSSRYHRWQGDFREALFPTIEYIQVTNLATESRIPKSPGMIAHSIISKCLAKSSGKTLLDLIVMDSGKFSLFYFRAVLYWFKVLTKPPIFREDGVDVETGEMKELTFSRATTRDVVMALLSSNLFSLHYTVWSSCQVVNSPDLQFPVDLERIERSHGKILSELAFRLIKDYQTNSIIQKRQYSARGRKFTMEKQYFFIKLSKSIIDEVDMVLTKHYGFTEEELDFIINYDIKYRMGQDTEKEEL
jgi:hypothetical protein